MVFLLSWDFLETGLKLERRIPAATWICLCFCLLCCLGHRYDSSIAHSLGSTFWEACGIHITDFSTACQATLATSWQAWSLCLNSKISKACTAASVPPQHMNCTSRNKGMLERMKMWRSAMEHTTTKLQMRSFHARSTSGSSGCPGCWRHVRRWVHILIAALRCEGCPVPFPDFA